MPEVIQAMTFTRKALFAPTGLLICARVMPPHWDVELVDECVLDAPHKPKADVDIVGISAMTTQAPRAYALADEYRRLGVTVVLGGIHPSALPKEALQHADAVCKGDAESTLPHFIADWEASVPHQGSMGLRPVVAIQRFGEELGHVAQLDRQIVLQLRIAHGAAEVHLALRAGRGQHFRPRRPRLE